MWRSGRRLRIRFAARGEWADFVVDERGTSVTMVLSDGVPEGDAAALLAGPVFSCLLAQRDACCLHAAVVEVAGQVIALAGASGAGKSTLALAVVRAGGSLVADDGAVLAVEDGRVTVAPGRRHVRLAPDAAAAHDEPFAELPKVQLHPDRGHVAKALVALGADEAAGGRPRRLGRLVFLDPREPELAAPCIRAVDAHDALLRLMRDRHALPLLDPEADRRHFPLLSEVARTVPAFVLRRPDALDQLAAVAAALTDRGHTGSPL